MFSGLDVKLCDEDQPVARVRLHVGSGRSLSFSGPVTELPPSPAWLRVLGHVSFYTIPLVERAALPEEQRPEWVSCACEGQGDSCHSTVPGLLKDGRKQGSVQRGPPPTAGGEKWRGEQGGEERPAPSPGACMLMTT